MTMVGSFKNVNLKIFHFLRQAAKVGLTRAVLMGNRVIGSTNVEASWPYHRLAARCKELLPESYNISDKRRRLRKFFIKETLQGSCHLHIVIIHFHKFKVKVECGLIPVCVQNVSTRFFFFGGVAGVGVTYSKSYDLMWFPFHKIFIFIQTADRYGAVRVTQL